MNASVEARESRIDIEKPKPPMAYAGVQAGITENYRFLPVSPRARQLKAPRCQRLRGGGCENPEIPSAIQSGASQAKIPERTQFSAEAPATPTVGTKRKPTPRRAENSKLEMRNSKQIRSTKKKFSKHAARAGSFRRFCLVCILLLVSDFGFRISCFALPPCLRAPGPLQ